MIEETPLKVARKRCGFRLWDVYERTGIAISYVSSLERNPKRAPSLKVARALAKVYACTVDDLFPEAGDAGART